MRLTSRQQRKSILTLRTTGGRPIGLSKNEIRDVAGIPGIRIRNYAITFPGGKIQTHVETTGKGDACGYQHALRDKYGELRNMWRATC